MSTGVELIAAERTRQIEAEGWSAEHDDEHEWELSAAASAYALAASDLVKATGTTRPMIRPRMWPPDWTFKPGDPIRMLTKAGALIAAEIDRLQRAAERERQP